ncbi:hypothetical protein L596_018651 [Steinernema carpocapsae]|uniref:SHSP domain-containing protein n=1 Tax=Steinernema carpocapsae TaxID=34508 RepID=A0A4U5N641_STECR|nr:hypothetical protein L596_018651 [Steinernema carpocapsae]
MALLLSDAFFPGFGSVRLHRRRDPFAALFGNSPLAESSKVAFKDGVLSIGFPTSAFKPEELEVNVVGNNLVVEAKHSSESESGSIERLFVQKVRLPRTSTLTPSRAPWTPKEISPSPSAPRNPPPLKENATSPSELRLPIPKTKSESQDRFTCIDCNYFFPNNKSQSTIC